MSVEVTRLPSGLTVVTDSMPHLETASLGVWVGSGSRDEQPDEHGISHLLEHMAFKGTKRRTRAPDRRGDRGGRRRPQCRDQLRDHRLLRARAQGRRAARARRAVRHPVESDLRSGRAQARAERHRAGDRRDRGRARRSRVRLSAGDRVSRPADRPLDPRHARDRVLVQGRATCAPISRATIARPTWWSRRPARSSMPRWWPRSSGGSATSTGPAAPVPQPAQVRRRHQDRGARSRAGAYRARARRRAAARSRACYSLQVFTSVLGGGMSSRLFQEVREKRGLCYTISAFHAPYTDTGMFGIYAGTDAGDVEGVDAGRGRRDRARRRRHHRGRGRRAKAQMKVGLLMALESSGARAGQLARQILTYGRPLPLDEIVAQDRGGDGRKRARRRPRADRAQPAGRRGARSGQRP